jgi:GrpB-like predicted nucleotidyltransferase (UPF0157 family)
VSVIAIVEPDPRWASEFDAIASRLREAAQAKAVRIDHIGSTSIRGLPAKDVIDVQVTVEDDVALPDVAQMLATHGWQRVVGIVDDHRVPACRPHLLSGGSASYASRLGTDARTCTFGYRGERISDTRCCSATTSDRISTPPPRTRA